MTQLFHSYLFAYLVVSEFRSAVLVFCFYILWSAENGGTSAGEFFRPALTLCPGPPSYLFRFCSAFAIFIHGWIRAVIPDSFSAGHKQIYFQSSIFCRARGFLFRSLVLDRLSPATDGKRQRHGASVMYVFSVSFASFDWVMSLEPQWSSSIYGAMLMVGDVLGALAFAIVILNRQSRSRILIPEDTAHDLGNLMLAFVMLWAYMALSQYMIIWSANLPEEIGWYLARQRGGWQWVAIVLVLLFQFILPFALLLSRQRKRKLRKFGCCGGGNSASCAPDRCLLG